MVERGISAPALEEEVPIFQRHFVNSLSGLVGLLVFKLSLIFPLEQAVLKSSERFPPRKSLEMQMQVFEAASSAKKAG